MNPRNATLLGAAVLLAIALAWLLEGSWSGAPSTVPSGASSRGGSNLPESGTAAGPAVGTPTPSEGADRIDANPVQSTPDASGADLPEPPTLIVRGRAVAAEDGSPVAGATISLSLYRAEDPGSIQPDFVMRHGFRSWTPPAPVVSGWDGSFELSYTQHAQLAMLHVRHPERVTFRRLAVSAVPNARAPTPILEMGNLPLEAGLSIRGQVVDTAGTPVDGVPVMLRPRLGSASVDPIVGVSALGGWVQFEDAIPQVECEVVLPEWLREPLGGRQPDVTPRAGTPLRFEVAAVAEDQWLTCRVQRPDGSTLTCRPYVRGKRSGRFAETFGDILFVGRVQGDDDPTVTVEPRVPGFHSENSQLPWGARDARIVLRPTSDLQVIGRFDDGTPLPWMMVYGAADDQGSPIVMGAGPTDEGALRCTRPGSGGLRLIAFGRRGHTISSRIVGVDATRSTVHVVVPRAQPREVRVRDQDGEPVPDVALSLLTPAGDGSEVVAEADHAYPFALWGRDAADLPLWIGGGTTDRAGHATLVCPTTQPCFVEVRGKSVRSAVHAVEPGTGAIDVRVVARKIVRGTLGPPELVKALFEPGVARPKIALVEHLDPTDPRPPERAFGNQWKTYDGGPLEADGSFECMVHTDRSVKALLVGGLGGSLAAMINDPLTLAASIEPRSPLQLHAPGLVPGTLQARIERKGEAARLYDHLVLDPVGASIDVVPSRSFNTDTGVLEGRVWPGTYAASTFENQLRIPLGHVAIAPGQRVERVFSTATGNLVLTLRNPAGEPIAEATVLDVDANVVLGKSDARGVLRLPHCPAGSMTLKVIPRFTGNATALDAIEIRDGETTEQTVTVPL